MVHRIEIKAYLDADELLPVIDVRTPAEYLVGHIPGAVNIPLFSNEERAIVGTAYKQESVDRAYELGYEFVNPRLGYYVTESKKVVREGKVAVYCWRGGMRSKAFADHIASHGISEVYVIEGGYKAFRSYAFEAFRFPDTIFILGGYTGSGKTQILRQLKTMGVQVIDLEKTANHKGSAFGAIGQDEQPTNEHFTNLLFWEWRKLDPTLPLWLEDESIHIGRVFIPEVLFQRMREAQVYFLKIDKDLRAQLLVGEYAGIDKNQLVEAVKRISKRLGGLRTSEALTALEKENYHETALITLDYYDKYYLKGLNRRETKKVVIIESDTIDPNVNAKKLLQEVQRTFRPEERVAEIKTIRSE